MNDSKKAEDHNGNPAPPPSWLDNELIQQALRNGGEENLQVAEISVGCATAAGDNYGSTIYRVKATLSDGSERSFIVKISVTSILPEGSSGLPPFVREASMLADILPQMEALLEEAAPGRFPPLAPRCFHHGTHPSDFIVMEDLAPPGFKIADRRTGLGLRHSLLALRSLARFHAASYALLERQPGLEQKLDNTWRSNYEGLQVFVEGEFRAAVDAFRSWSGFEEYGDRLDKFRLVALETFAQLNDAKPGAFNVIAHGDFWMNNMMFSYDGDFPKNHRLIDLQLSHLASPATDIVYFLASSLSDNVHEHHQDLLIREYHCELKKTMELLGLEAPALESLLSAIDVHGSLSLFVAMGKPIQKAEHGINMAALFTGDHSAMVELYDLPAVKKWMRRVVPDYARRGWLPA